jgi:hypothetical protein
MKIDLNPDKYKAVIKKDRNGKTVSYDNVMRNEEEYRESRKNTLLEKKKEFEEQLSAINKELSLIERGVTPPSFFKG